MKKLKAPGLYWGKRENNRQVTTEDLGMCQSEDARVLRLVTTSSSGGTSTRRVVNCYRLGAEVLCKEEGERRFFIAQGDPVDEVCKKCTARRYCRHTTQPEIIATDILLLGTGIPPHPRPPRVSLESLAKEWGIGTE